MIFQHGYPQGYDLSSNTAAGTLAALFVKAINAVSNPDEFDINMLVIAVLSTDYTHQ